MTSLVSVVNAIDPLNTTSRRVRYVEIVVKWPIRLCLYLIPREGVQLVYTCMCLRDKTVSIIATLGRFARFHQLTQHGDATVRQNGDSKQ